MPDLSLIREHMQVIGADGQHVGAVLRLDGERLYLATGGETTTRKARSCRRP